MAIHATGTKALAENFRYLRLQMLNLLFKRNTLFVTGTQSCIFFIVTTVLQDKIRNWSQVQTHRPGHQVQTMSKSMFLSQHWSAGTKHRNLCSLETTTLPTSQFPGECSSANGINQFVYEMKKKKTASSKQELKNK